MVRASSNKTANNATSDKTNSHSSKTPNAPRASTVQKRQTVSSVVREEKKSATTSTTSPQKRTTLSGVKRNLNDSYSQPSLPYVKNLDGPLLFTAPHGLEVFRGGDEYSKEPRRVHLREMFSTEIALKLALHCVDYSSFMVWNFKTARKKDPSNTDPNYLFKQQFANSPWNRMLHEWRDKYQHKEPFLLHVDIHGKMERKRDGNVQYLDIGLMPMQVLWRKQSEVKYLKECLSRKIQEALDIHNESEAGKVKKYMVDSDPRLHGYWGEDMMTTMSHQSAMLGIPAVQLEIPFSLRNLLMTDNTLFDHFASAIQTAFMEATTHTQEEQSDILMPAKTNQTPKKTEVLQEMLLDLNNEHNRKSKNKEI